MNAKHSAILLSGLLLLMMGIAWAQTSNSAIPTCPVVIYEANVNYRPSSNAHKWVRADWNAKADRWEIDCDSELPSMNAANSTTNAWPMSNSYYNTISNSANWNASTNAVNAAANMPARNAANVRPRRSIKREPNTRRPGD